MTRDCTGEKPCKEKRRREEEKKKKKKKRKKKKKEEPSLAATENRVSFPVPEQRAKRQINFSSDPEVEDEETPQDRLSLSPPPPFLPSSLSSHPLRHSVGWLP
ncbi:uncharacterized protein ARB_04453 [Trichophyton benhamiae CBS 112371]|uniref:Uncharacterized protein n=1 Tax=Arthroderma benhamiae (strain ATCC MYA-4681 / CBS 112371) TaxID=663331 RepID=D4AJK3_ARTBC|nr:uncharacterized protein ARB_04453 [Trichophyton benhamiae CBS 112371]EFE36926.1 hypothetical protein ARB_04453 [Trichophyton benhamiae CBS 112371]